MRAQCSRSQSAVRQVRVRREEDLPARGGTDPPSGRFVEPAEPARQPAHNLRLSQNSMERAFSPRFSFSAFLPGALPQVGIGRAFGAQMRVQNDVGSVGATGRSPGALPDTTCDTIGPPL